MTEAPPSATDGPLGPALSPVAGATLWSGIQSIVLLYKSGSTGHTGHTGHAQSQGHRWTAPLSDSVRARSRSHAPLQGEVHSLVWKGGYSRRSPQCFACITPTDYYVCVCMRTPWRASGEMGPGRGPMALAKGWVGLARPLEPMALHTASTASRTRYVHPVMLPDMYRQP